VLLRVIGLLFLLQHGLNGNQIVDHVVASKLNEPLSINLSFDLSKSEDSDLSIKLASKNRYQQYGIERPKLLDGIKISHIESKTDSKKNYNINTEVPVTRASFILLFELRDINKNGLISIPVTLFLEDTSGQYSIQPGDTLWSIAYKNRPSDQFTMDQMMIALYQNNHDLFSGNINDIKEGIVEIPSEDLISLVPSESIFSVDNLSLYQVDENAIQTDEEINLNFNQKADIAYESSEADSFNNDINIRLDIAQDDYELSISEGNTSQNESIYNADFQKEISNETGRDEKKLVTKSPKITTETRVIVKNKGINFKEILQILDNFWALIVLGAVLVLFIMFSIVKKFKNDKNSIADLENSISDNEIATKLDLARAYVDMGEPDGAYEILDEVISKGNKSQQLLAKKLLKSIDS
jgi:FimV-like protein